jgi:ectoine hydroxylase
MKLNDDQLSQFREDGYVFLPDLFSPDEVAVLRGEIDRFVGIERDEIMRDEQGELFGAFAVDRYSDAFARLLRHPRLLEPAQQLLGPALYAHQYKIISKDPFGKLDFAWHQDAASWQAYDGMPEPLAMNYALFLDEVSEFNGPITLIPQSHRDGILGAADGPRPGGKSPLRTLTNEMVQDLAAAHGLVAPKGKAGSAIFFSGCLAHASGPNISPWTRYIVYLSYNPVTNAITAPTRPDFYAERDNFTALEMLGDDCLAAGAEI